MILASAVSTLILYFALSLGVSGLAKIDRPFVVVERSGKSLSMKLIGLFFSPITGRVLGAVEIVLAFLLALGIQTKSVAMANAALFSLFLLFKLFLILTKQGSWCGCFGAHELIAIDLASMIASSLVFGLAVILAVLTQWSLTNALSEIIAIIFLTAFGWLVFKMVRRRRLENKLIRQISTGTVTIERP